MFLKEQTFSSSHTKLNYLTNFQQQLNLKRSRDLVTYYNETSKLATPLQKRKETTPKTTGIASSKEATWTVNKVSTQPSQGAVFSLL
jgi:hypothetical protein